MPVKLTENLVRKTLPPVRSQTILWDETVKGFGLRVTRAGAKAFVLDYRAEGRQRRITIGSWPDWSVAAAREAAKGMKRDVDAGRDPMGERQAEREAPTVEDLWARYASEHLPRKAERSQADERSMWEQIILPRLGKQKLASVTHEDVDALHRDITEIRGTPVRANRTIEVLRKAFNLAIRWKWCADNPASGVRRNPEEPRQRYLDKGEISALIAALNAHPERSSANAIKLLMLTGARRSEVLQASWDMFDLENGVWTKPSAHTKQRRLHRVPLSGPAVALLRQIRAEAEGNSARQGEPVNPYVFPGPTGGPLSDVKRTWAAVCTTAGLVTSVPKKRRSGEPALDRSGEPVTALKPNVRLHDLRHSFASILASSGASLPLIGQLLGHTQSQTTLRYAHLFDDPLREAADKVGALVIPEGSGQVRPAIDRPS